MEWVAATGILRSLSVVMTLHRTAHHIFLLERIHDELLKLGGDEISTVGVHALGEHIVEHPLAAQMQTEVLAVGVRRSAGLGFAGRFLGCSVMGEDTGFASSAAMASRRSMRLTSLVRSFNSFSIFA